MSLGKGAAWAGLTVSGSRGYMRMGWDERSITHRRVKGQGCKGEMLVL